MILVLGKLDMNYKVKRTQDSLQHFGIKGMHWGERRYQNEDGSLTAAGAARYNSELRATDRARIEKRNARFQRYVARKNKALVKQLKNSNIDTAYPEKVLKEQKQSRINRKIQSAKQKTISALKVGAAVGMAISPVIAQTTVSSIGPKRIAQIGGKVAGKIIKAYGKTTLKIVKSGGNLLRNPNTPANTIVQVGTNVTNTSRKIARTPSRIIRKGGSLVRHVL